MPELSGVLETSLYVEDIGRAAEFYKNLFDFSTLFVDGRLCALDVSGKQVLLLFKQGSSTSPSETPDGMVPGHDGEGSLHLALAIPASQLDAWEMHLSKNGVSIESRVSWSRGGVSLYFRDPDNHLIELATPGLWATY